MTRKEIEACNDAAHIVKKNPVNTELDILVDFK